MMSRTPFLLGGALLGAVMWSSPFPAAAQSRADACLNETGRLASSMLDAPDQQQLAGGRQGAKLEDAQKDRVRGLLDEARTAARNGDADRCIENLREARMEVRNSGVGRGGGSPGADEATSGTASSGSSGMSPGTPGLGQGSVSPDSPGGGGATGSMGSGSMGSGSMGGGSVGSGSGGAGSSGGGL